ncbi:MAG: hypothetical protein RTU92_10115 [Candidatus Thorarchaeota archaeon]
MYSESYDIQRSHVAVIEAFAFILVLVFTGMGWTRTLVDAAIVVVAFSIVGYISLRVYTGMTMTEEKDDTSVLQ